MNDPMQSAGPRGRRTGARSQRAAERQAQNTTLDLFAAASTPDLDGGRRRRDDGHRVAENNTLPGVKAALERIVRELATSGEPFTAEDLRARCQPLGSSPNVIGAAISAAAERGEIRRVGFVQAHRPKRTAGGSRSGRVRPDELPQH